MNPIATTVWTCECGMFHRTEETAIGCCLCKRCDEPRQKPYIYCTEHLREHDEARKAEERAKALAAPFAPVDYAGWVYIPDGDIFAENAEMAAEAYWDESDDVPDDWSTIIAHPCREVRPRVDLVGHVEEYWYSEVGDVYDDAVEVPKALRDELDELGTRIDAAAPVVYWPIESFRVALTAPRAESSR
jgi:hypothetical protein